MPTVLEAVGLPAPVSVNGVQQKPVEGVSMVYAFDDAKAPSQRTTQYFEMLGNRAIYHDGWVAATTPIAPPWAAVAKPVDLIDGYKWELYNVAEDFSAGERPRRSEPGEAARAAAAVLHRGGQVQRAAARQQQGRAARRPEPPEH